MPGPYFWGLLSSRSGTGPRYRSFLNVPQVILKYISLLRTGSLDQYFANLNMQMNQLGSWLNVGSDPVSVD